MSDDKYTNDEDRNYKIELERLLREVGPRVLDNWRQILTEGGKQSVNVVCASCGRGTKASVPVADVQQQRLILTFLQEQISEKVAAELGASKIIRDRSELSDAELADYITRLQAEIAAASTPAREELSSLLERLNDDHVSLLVTHAKTMVPDG